MSDTTPTFIALDWGTTRLRATLLGPGGEVLQRRDTETGVQSVPAGGFPDALEAAAGDWLGDDPELPVLMAGMVGSRNGWREAPYVTAPCGLEALRAKLMRVEGLHDVRIVPGVECRWPDGAYDVMRGEEVQAFGTGLDDGIVCLPGTHSKWVEMAKGTIVRFGTFITGELYAAMCQSFVGRLAEEPAHPEAGVAAGTRMATLPGGLARLLFQARSQVLGGGLPASAVRPFLSSLIVGEELNGALALFGAMRAVCLVAAPPQRDIYAAALLGRGIAFSVVDPAEASLRGIARLAERTA